MQVGTLIRHYNDFYKPFHTLDFFLGGWSGLNWTFISAVFVYTSCID